MARHRGKDPVALTRATSGPPAFRRWEAWLTSPAVTRLSPVRAFSRSLATLAMLASAASAAAAQEPLSIHVQYPPAGASITASDSTFVFGRVEGASGSAVELTVNGTAVAVHDEGGWLAFVPVEPDSFTFRIRARSDGRRAEAERTVWVPPPPGAPGDPDLGYRPGTIEPAGALELYAGDTLRVSVVADPRADIVARIGGHRTPLLPEPVVEPNRGRQVFGRVAPPDPGSSEGTWVRFAADVYLPYGGVLADSLWLEVGPPDGELRTVPVAEVEFLDPTRVRAAVVDDDTAGTGRTDHRIVARSGPRAGYYLFLPNGTRVATARRIGTQREIALGPGTSAWVSTDESFPSEAPAPRSAPIAVVRARVVPGWSEVVIPTTARVPFDLAERQDPVRYTVRLYHTGADTDWIRYAPDDPLIEEIRWSETSRRVYELEIDLDADQAWGFRARWEGTHLVLGFRHPPPALADRRFRSALHDVRIVLDPGHNPGAGAVGPTGLEEREANLGIALELAEVLRKRGAEVVLTRASADSMLGLYDRTNLAVARGGEIFVSIHNNALPDGVNPFENNGTSTFFYYPHSRPLAEAIQGELLPRTGLADYGVAEGNLAVVRMNEMPAVLVESAFMMIPEQEALLRTRTYRRSIAEGIAAGIERFLEERGENPSSR